MPEAQPHAFLDRDGTLIEERNYLSDPDQAVLLPGVAEGLKTLMAQGFRLVVVSNQSGVGRGYFTEAQAHLVNARVDELLRAQGVDIAAWYICPHASDQSCDCRKPLPGMVDQAAADFPVDLTRSIMIGDKDIDLQLATARGMRGFLVTSGHAAKHIGWARENGFGVFADIPSIAASLSSPFC
jgi:histidinol-phosphate phosphatase family protein